MGRKLQARINKGLLDGELKSGQWYRYEDLNGYGCCQTDHELHLEDYIILLECKLTQSDIAFPQMVKLYVPVLREVYDKPVIPVLACKNMRKAAKNSIKDIEDLVKRPLMKLWTWHYLAER